MANDRDRQAEIHQLRAEVFRRRAAEWRARQAKGLYAKLRELGLTHHPPVMSELITRQ